MDMPAGARRPKISATDAAFAGFALVRRSPGALAVWTALTLVYGLVAAGLQAWLAGPSLARIAALQAAGATPPTNEEAMQILGSLGGFALFYVAVLIAALIYGSVMNAAVFRALLRPTERGFGYLRFGTAELRQGVVGFLVGLTIYGVYIAAVIVGVIVLVAVVVAAVAVSGGKGGGASDSPMAITAAVIGAVLMVLIVVIPILVVAVRLCLAGPATFDRGRIDVFGSWRLTKGRFWTLIGAYLLAGLIMLVLTLLVMSVVVVGALLCGVSLETVSRTLIPDPKTMDAYLTPLRLAFMVVNAPVSALWIAVQSSIPATVYAQATAEGGGFAGSPPIDRSHAFGSAVAYPTPAATAAPPTPPRLP